MPHYEPAVAGTPYAPTLTDVVDLQLTSAIRAAAALGTGTTVALHEAVCRYARLARRHQVPTLDVVHAIVRRARPHFAALPAWVSNEFERQVGWWVAQEYHRDD